MGVSFNSEKKEIYIEDIGVTVRTLLAVGAKGYTESQNRKWHIVYKNARIGTIQVKTENLKGIKNARPAIRAKESNKVTTSETKTIDRTDVALDEGSSRQHTDSDS